MKFTLFHKSLNIIFFLYSDINFKYVFQIFHVMLIRHFADLLPCFIAFWIDLVIIFKTEFYKKSKISSYSHILGGHRPLPSSSIGCVPALVRTWSIGSQIFNDEPLETN